MNAYSVERSWALHSRIVARRGRVAGDDDDLRFLALSLAGETGEFANIIKKEWRGDGALDQAKAADELADVVSYANLLLHGIGAGAVPVSGRCELDDRTAMPDRIRCRAMRLAATAGAIARDVATFWRLGERAPADMVLGGLLALRRLTTALAADLAIDLPAALDAKWLIVVARYPELAAADDARGAAA